MKLKKPELLKKIKRLNQMVNKLSEHFSTFHPEMQHILKTSPQALSDLKDALQRKDKQTLIEVHTVLDKMEAIINQAVEMNAGRSMADSIRYGVSPNQSLPTSYRLNQRMTGFLAKHIDRKMFSDLIKEFCGKEAVQGNEIYMDPNGETEAFSQWILFDKVLKGFPKRLAEVFAGDGELPLDERKLLEAQLQDRPSIYRVIKLNQKIEIDKYLVEDLLSEQGKVFKIKDRSTLESISKGTVFVGRAFPMVDEVSVYLLMGNVTKISEDLWKKLFLSIEKWKKESDFSERETDFFRAHHAKIQSFIHGRNV